MTLNRVQALRTQRQLVLDYCAGLTDADWSAPSQAAGWRVRDVIAHFGGTCRGLFSRHAITLVFSNDTERTNEELLAPRRAWPTDRVLDEFAQWSRAFAAVASVADQPLIGSAPLRVGSLGRYPVRKLVSMLVFDWHTHLTYDVAPAINRPAPPIDDHRLAATLEWMLSGLEQMNRDQMRWLDKSLTLTLTGPAGGTWSINPAGQGRLTVTESTGTTTAAAAAITGVSTDFPAWATNRIGWRSAGSPSQATRSTPKSSSTPSTSSDEPLVRHRSNSVSGNDKSMSESVKTYDGSLGDPVSTTSCEHRRREARGKP